MASDQNLVAVTMKMMLKCQPKKRLKKALDLDRLKDAKKQKQFQLELRNRFNLPSHDTEHTLGVEDWNIIKDIILKTTQEVVAFKRGSQKEQ